MTRRQVPRPGLLAIYARRPAAPRCRSVAAVTSSARAPRDSPASGALAPTSWRSTRGDQPLPSAAPPAPPGPWSIRTAISERKDVVLFGSERAERYVSGAAVRAQLAKWGLGFTVRDGVQADVTASKTVAWVAANVDAAKKGGKPTPYRVLAVYEKAGPNWQVVALHFSSVFEI